MRPLVLVLLMLLLPLRAWAGDAMALSMLHESPAQAMAMESATSGDHVQADHHDHHDQPDLHAGYGEPAAQAGDDCPSHVACDVCNGPVLSLPIWQAEGSVARHHPPASASTDFASLVPPRHHKPPIA